MWDYQPLHPLCLLTMNLLSVTSLRVLSRPMTCIHLWPSPEKYLVNIFCNSNDIEGYEYFFPIPTLTDGGLICFQTSLGSPSIEGISWKGLLPLRLRDSSLKPQVAMTAWPYYQTLTRYFLIIIRDNNKMWQFLKYYPEKEAHIVYPKSSYKISLPRSLPVIL